MTLTALDWKTALIIVDLQKGVVSRPLAHPVTDVVKNASALADAFRTRGLPVVLVNVAGIPPGRTEQVRHLGDLPAGWTDLIPGEYPEVGGVLCGELPLMPLPEIRIPAFEARV